MGCLMDSFDRNFDLEQVENPKSHEEDHSKLLEASKLEIYTQIMKFKDVNGKGAENRLDGESWSNLTAMINLKYDATFTVTQLKSFKKNYRATVLRTPEIDS